LLLLREVASDGARAGGAFNAPFAEVSVAGFGATRNPFCCAF
jgi:hypothetical protein